VADFGIKLLISTDMQLGKSNHVTKLCY